MRGIFNASTAAVTWAMIYFVVFQVLGGSIYIPLMVLRGVFFTAVIVVCMFGVWGSIFYLILLHLDAFDHIQDFIDQLSGKKELRVFARIQMIIINLMGRFYRGGGGKELIEKVGKKVDDAHTGRIVISPQWIILVFVFLSPIFAVPLIRLAYPSQRWALGLMWVWIGALAEVATWFLPFYGAGEVVVRLVVALFNGG